METNAKKKTEDIVEEQHIYEYQEIYNALKALVVDPTLLLQAFTLNNNTDIIKAIEYWKAQIQGENDPNTVKINNIIKQYENVMLFRLYITQDLHTNSLPLMEQGPVSKVETKSLDIKDTKVIEHPASKGKKKETVNEKVGKEVKKEGEKEKKETSLKTDYDKLYPTDQEKLDALTVILPSIEKDIKEGREKEAARKLKYHFKSYGDKIPFCTLDQIKSLVHWIKEDKFQHISPFNILHDKPLSISDILKEAEKLVKEDGLGEQEVKDYLEYYVLDNQLAEQKESEVFHTKEEYDNFFQRSIVFLFDEQQREQEIKEEKKGKATRASIKEALYETHKNEGIKAIGKIAKDLHEWVIKEENEKYTLDGARAETAVFIKSKDPKMYEEYDKRRSKKIGTSGGEKKETSKVEVKQETSEETIETDGEEGKTNVITSKTVFGRLEKALKYKTKIQDLSEFLITIVNKHMSPIGDRIDGLSHKIEDLTILANKAFLEIGVQDKEGKELSDWTEKDVLHYMGEDVVPFISDDYGILKSKDEEDLLLELEYYMEKYDVGEQKKRTEVLKAVLLSEIPRTKYMKTIAKKVRKDNFTDLNDLFKKLAEKQIEKQKEKNKEKEEKTK